MSTRADTLAIKAQLGELLGSQGEFYWEAFGRYLTGKATREEFDLACLPILQGDAAQLHDDLILAVLHNVTAPSLPPSSARHSGWLKKRKSGPAAELSSSGPEAKRRRLGDAVMSLGKRERSRLKALSNNVTHVNGQSSFLEGSTPMRRKPDAPIGTPKTIQGKSAAFQQDFARCRSTPLCSESLQLPDLDSLQARMTWSAFQAGLLGGTDSEAVTVLMAALKGHLKSILERVLQIKKAQGVSDHGSLTTADIAVLSELAPGSVGQPPTGAICRSAALLAKQSDFADGMTKLEQILDNCPTQGKVLREETHGVPDPLQRRFTINPDYLADRFKLPQKTSTQPSGARLPLLGNDQIAKEPQDLAMQIFPEEKSQNSNGKSKKPTGGNSSSEDEAADGKKRDKRKTKEALKRNSLLDVVDTYSLCETLI